MTKNEKQNTGEPWFSGVRTLGRFHTGNNWFGFVAGRLNSECPQQDRANESEHGAYSEHIPLQGKLHGSASLLESSKASRKHPRSEGIRAPKTQKLRFVSCAAGMSCAND
jgi:hypothetical protein